MELYDQTSFATSRLLTKAYSTSFSFATRQFPREMRQDIYNIYGLVRLADEVVDTYKGKDAHQLLDALEQETYDALIRGYSTNIVVHAFALTARKVKITKKLIEPFYQSMRSDLTQHSYTSEEYSTYIYGSAEVVGLMCLKVFCKGHTAEYKRLEEGAKALGSAFQKVNFLRDLAADYTVLGRTYFPEENFEEFNEKVKRKIIDDIKSDFKVAHFAITQLDNEVRPAVLVAYTYYQKLLTKIETTPAQTLKQQRLRINNSVKIGIILKVIIGEKIKGFFK